MIGTLDMAVRYNDVKTQEEERDGEADCGNGGKMLVSTSCLVAVSEIKTQLSNPAYSNFKCNSL